MTPDDHSSRRDELTLAAASGTLSPADRAELDALRVHDPTVDVEVDALRQVLVRLESLGEWDDEPPSADLGERVIAAVQAGPDAPARSPRRRRGRRWVAAVAASAVVVAGGIGGALLLGPASDDPPPAVGALGVEERLDVEDVASGVDLHASVVPHTWGTEAILEADGLEAGREYDLVVVEDDGVEVPAGGFLGSRQTVHCHLNAPVMRQDASLLQVRTGDGRVVGWARLPQVGG